MESVKEQGRPLQNGYAHQVETSRNRPYSPTPSHESASASVTRSSAPSPSFLRPLHLVIFSLIHATYALLVALHDAFEWTSPSEAIREARAIGRAIQSSADPSSNGKGKSPTMKAPKHLALVLQTPFYDDTEGGSEEAERLALEYLRSEVRRVAQWCDQLGVQRLTVMDTDGVLSAAAESAQPSREAGVEQVLGIANEISPVNGWAKLHTGVLSSQSGGEDAAVSHLRQRTRTRLRHEDSAAIAVGAKHALNGSSSSHPDDLLTIGLPVDIIGPLDGDRIFATVADEYRVELEAKCRSRVNNSSESPSGSGIKVRGSESRKEDSWARTNRDKDGSPFLGSSSTASEHELEDLDKLRAQLVEWINQITVPELDKALSEYGYITEPDFMILHGVPRRSVQLGGFPAWSIRLTEIFHDPQADPRRPITLATFVRAIKYFNNTEHRFGK